MNLLGIDLHIHSALSPCGGEEMTPPNILMQAKRTGLEGLVIADHNSAENQEAFLQCAETLNIKILPGMEVQSKEDVHMLCIFDRLEQILAFQEIIYEYLPPINNNREIFGPQNILDWQGNIIGENQRLLLTGVNLSVDDITKKVDQLAGLTLPAHIDRQAFSLWTNLGFIPENLGFLGVELTFHLPRNKRQIQYLRDNQLGVVLSSDAHWLNQIQGPHTRGYLQEFTVAELKLALKSEQGRYLTYREDPFRILNE
ncbi:MAG: PHP domain-containing protein [Peptococcaceae bacterium]